MKNIVLIFSLHKVIFFSYSVGIYKSVKASIGAVMKKTEMLKFVCHHLKVKKMYKHVVKKLSFVYVSDQHKTQKNV